MCLCCALVKCQFIVVSQCLAFQCLISWHVFFLRLCRSPQDCTLRICLIKLDFWIIRISTCVPKLFLASKNWTPLWTHTCVVLSCLPWCYHIKQFTAFFSEWPQKLKAQSVCLHNLIFTTLTSDMHLHHVVGEAKNIITLQASLLMVYLESN